MALAVERLTLRPVGLEGRAGAGPAAPLLAGGWLQVSALEVTYRAPDGELCRTVLPLESAPDWAGQFGQRPAAEAAIRHLLSPRQDFAGLRLDRPRIMGIINVTPDSFSDGGDRFESRRAVADGLALREAGADILDIGGESTRPGAEPISEQQEMDRVLPVVEALAAEGALISIDSRHAAVMAAALDQGAAIVNDVTALTGDPAALDLVASRGCPVVLMHMQGQPQTMQVDPTYEDAAHDIFDYLAERVRSCEAAGLDRGQIAIDPGIGFGKTVAHNLRILEQLALFHGLGCPVLLGASRKAFIGRLSGAAAPKDRLAGSLAAALAGVARGVQILRVHDVAETYQALAIWREIVSADGEEAS